MKKHLLTLLLSALILLSTAYFSWAQNIIGITMQPTTPTHNDSITFFADCMFSSGNCDPYQMGGNLLGSDYLAYALHCLGPLSFICNHIDSFKIAPLPVGNHRFIFHLDEGYGVACTPGIVAGPTDTLNFFVASTTGINETVAPTSFNITPNPSNGNIIIKLENSLLLQLPAIELFNASGQLIKTISVYNKETPIHIDLNSGMYWYRLKNHTCGVKKLIIIK